MITIPPWQRIGIILLVAFGLLAAIPTFIGKQASQEIGILPGGPIELGLDLQGGAHLLLEVASNDLVAERLENIRDDVRDKLRRQQPAIGYRRLDADRDLGQLTITPGRPGIYPDAPMPLYSDASNSSRTPSQVL